MSKRISLPNQVSEINSFTNRHAKERKLEIMDKEQTNGLLSNNSIVKFCKESIIQQNDVNKKGKFI